MQISPQPEADLAAVLERLLGLLRQIATAGDLSAPAASVLAWLAREGPQRLTDLAAHQRVAQPGMTQLITRLEAEGLVRRAPGADDRRVVVVAMTDRGRDVVERRRAERAAAVGRLLSLLESADQAAIRGAVPALARLADRGQPSSSPTAASPRL